MFRKICTAAVFFLVSVSPSFALGIACVAPDPSVLIVPPHPTVDQLRVVIQDGAYDNAESDYYRKCLGAQFTAKVRAAAQAAAAQAAAQAVAQGTPPPPPAPPANPNIPSMDADTSEAQAAMNSLIAADNARRQKALVPLLAALTVYKAAHPKDPDLWGQSPAPSQQISCDPFPADYPVTPIPDGPQLVAYPPESVSAQEGGRVLVSFDISVSGWALSPRIVKSSGYPRLDSAVLGSVTSWKFQPVLAGGSPVTFRDAKYVNFVLPTDASQPAHAQMSDSCVFHWPHATGALLIPVGPHFGAYPVRALRLGEQGAVGVSIIIRPDGTVTDPQVALSSGFPELDQGALSSALLWLYHPVPKPVHDMVDVRFRLQ
jgi:periplasmic protein TonB